MGRSPESNPFTPGFGNLPRVFAGRKAEFSDLELMVNRLAAGVYEQPRLVTGDRGVGKTTLLREFEEEQTEAGRWVVRAAATRGDAVIRRLARELGRVLEDRDSRVGLSRQAAAALGRLSGVEVAGVSVALNPPQAEPEDRAAQLAELLGNVGELAREERTVALLLIDEAQNISPRAIADLFFAIQEAQSRTWTSVDAASRARVRHATPLGVVVAGLPGLVAHLQRAGSTFGERSKPVPLQAFDEADVREGLAAFADAGGAAFDAEAVDLVVEASGGYPYFLHVVGSHVWNAGSGTVITADEARTGIAAARNYLDAFYEERLRELTAAQRRYVDAAAALPTPERSAGAVAAALGTSSRQLASTWQALTGRHGLLRSAGGRGRFAFTLPGLDAYLRRTSL
ncbi:MAG: ATP-binding protein [Actinomycetota bacterium]|nr:ATP-binding protein [Actinomycetota bacterium]